MTFKEINSLTNYLINGDIAYKKADFIFNGELFSDNRVLIHEFINFPQDFKVADKIINGTTWQHTDQKGISGNFVVFNFGPYMLNKLEIEDYIEIKSDKLKIKALDILTDVGANNKELLEYRNFITSFLDILSQMEADEIKLYLLEPPIEKLAEFTPFDLKYYLCAFCIDIKSNKLSVIQIDDR